MPASKTHNASDATDAELYLYLHWPFCEKICPYCDFNVARARNVDTDQWQAAYLNELERLFDRFPHRRIETIYFGGGTPSLIPPQVLERIIGKVTSLWRTAQNLEVSLEANPSDVTSEHARALRVAGINRVSLGIQSINDQALKFLGRWHDAAQAQAAFASARETFDNLSVDLIYARPGQTTADWQAELAEVLAWQPDHISLYQLTIEPGTAFDRAATRGTLIPPSDDIASTLYRLSSDLCAAAGLPFYEVSNHARPGKESRHNVCYWTGKDYAGLGPGAHGRLTVDSKRFATETVKKPTDWLSIAGTARAETTSWSQLSEEEIYEERVFMGLRTREGLPLRDLLNRPSVLPDLAPKLDQLAADGYVKTTDTHVSLTPAGRLVLNAIVAHMLISS